MTGKVDQNGNRLSTYSYDAAGLASSTELAGGVNKYQISNLEDTSWGAKFIREMTNPLGYRQDFVFFKEHNNSDAQRVLKSVTNYAMLGVEASTTNYNYYGDVGDMGIADYTDEGGRILHYDIDAGLRPNTTREATGTSDQRTTTTTWDPVFDLRHVQRPGLTTDYTYSPTGLLLTVKLTDTTHTRQYPIPLPVRSDVDVQLEWQRASVVGQRSEGSRCQRQRRHYHVQLRYQWEPAHIHGRAREDYDLHEL